MRRRRRRGTGRVQENRGDGGLLPPLERLPQGERVVPPGLDGMGVRPYGETALPGPQAAVQAAAGLPGRQGPDGRLHGDRARLERRHRRVPLRLLLLQRPDHAAGGAGGGLPQGAQPRQDEVRAHVVLPRALEPVPSEVRPAPHEADGARAHARGVPRPHRPLHQKLLPAPRVLAQGRPALLFHLQRTVLREDARSGKGEGRARGGAQARARGGPRGDRVQHAERGPRGVRADGRTRL